MSTIPPSLLQSSHPPIEPLPFTALQPAPVRLHPLSDYIFSTKEAQPEEDASVAARLQRLQDHYERHGMRRTCEAVLVCHEHNHPHVLMLQIANAFFKLPGGHLSPTDPELPTLQHILTTNLSPTNPNPKPPPFTWPIHSTLTTWTRPHFSTTMYPYTPPHITRPKEIKKLYLVPLPARAELAVPKNMKLLAVPLHELYDNSARYGALLSAIPHYLSAVRWEFVDEEGEVCGGSAGGGGWEREEGEKGEGQAAVVVERKRRKEVEGEEDATEDEVKADDIKGEEKLQRDDYVLVDAQIQAQAHPRSGEEEEAEEEQTTNGSAAESNFRMEEDIG